MNPAIYLASAIMSLIVILCVIEKINKTVFKLSLPTGYRDGCIDGLRGFLAIFVFFHHFFILESWLITGRVDMPQTAYLANMGVASVQIFFMITAYLFIKKIKQANPPWLKIYKSRFFRITPLYLFAVIITLLYSSILSTGSATPVEHLKAILSWLIYFGDSYPTYPDANMVTAGVTWTLKYEWAFYLLLPLFFIMIRKKLSITLFLLVLILYAINFSAHGIIATNFISFAFGWFVVVIEEKAASNSKTYFDTAMFSSLLLAVAILICTIAPEGRIGLLSVQVCCFVIFFLVSRGCSIFGLLRCRAATVLGEVSYSIYLTHGIAIFTLNIFVGIALTIYSLPLFLFAVTIFSMITYKYIEKPFININKGKSKTAHNLSRI